MNSASAEMRPALFCLHALGASHREFDALRAELPDFDVIALDLPGFGDRSTASGVTVDDMVKSVIRSIRKSGSVRWALVGHSMGGKVATIVAERTLSGEAGLYGIAGVVLLAASPPSPEPMDEQRRMTMLSWADDGALAEPAAREFVDANVGSPLDAASDAQMMTDVQRSSPEAWRAWLERGSREDWSADVGQLDLPALIVAGGADGDLGEKAQRELNGRVYPRARFLTLAGAGHLLPYERPTEVAAAIAAFWRDDAGTAPTVPADFGRMIASPRTSAKTRGILVRRHLADDPRYAPRVLSDAQLNTLRAVADQVVPQDLPPIDLAARVDAQLASGIGDGWRNAALPNDDESYRRGLDALADFARLDSGEQHTRLTAVAAGEFAGTGDLTAEQLGMWFEDCRVDLVRHWLAHPATMARIGFDGFANGGDRIRIQGFQLLGADEREGWEPTLEMAR